MSFLQEDGAPGICERVSILPPQSRLGAVDDARRGLLVHGSQLYSKYAETVDPDSAYEFLMRMGLEAEAEEEKAAAADERRKKQITKSVGNSIAGTVGLEVGRSALSGMGSLGKKVGANAGASLARGLFSTLFKL